MKLAGSWQMTQLCAMVAFTYNPYKSPKNRIWPPLGDWPLWPNHVRYRNVWYLVGKIIHRAIFSQKTEVPAMIKWCVICDQSPRAKKTPRGFKGQNSPGPIGLKIGTLLANIFHPWLLVLKIKRVRRLRLRVAYSLSHHTYVVLINLFSNYRSSCKQDKEWETSWQLDLMMGAPLPWGKMKNQ